jgi:hypothetical protein
MPRLHNHWWRARMPDFICQIQSMTALARGTPQLRDRRDVRNAFKSRSPGHSKPKKHKKEDPPHAPKPSSKRRGPRRRTSATNHGHAMFALLAWPLVSAKPLRSGPRSLETDIFLGGGTSLSERVPRGKGIDCGGPGTPQRHFFWSPQAVYN